MPHCTKCNAYTKYEGGLCLDCFKQKKDEDEPFSKIEINYCVLPKGLTPLAISLIEEGNHKKLKPLIGERPHFS